MDLKKGPSAHRQDYCPARRRRGGAHSQFLFSWSSSAFWQAYILIRGKCDFSVKHQRVPQDASRMSLAPRLFMAQGRMWSQKTKENRRDTRNSIVGSLTFRIAAELECGSVAPNHAGMESLRLRVSTGLGLHQTLASTGGIRHNKVLRVEPGLNPSGLGWREAGMLTVTGPGKFCTTLRLF